jgi:DNA primase
MDENQHKAVLEQRNIRRWIKTNPAGWFSSHPAQFAQTLVLVEGGFDRLALLAAGLPVNQVIALVGTAARPGWIVTYAPQVKRIILALDADSGGQDATWRLAAGFREVGLAVQLSLPPQDGWGKDWSERYRRNGEAGVQSLLAALHTSLNS